MRLLKAFIKVFKFLYSLFIVIQLSILAVIESKRIKDFLTVLSNNSKRIRIRDARDW